jgi:succinoglycan biosynthesis protein ExoA
MTPRLRQIAPAVNLILLGGGLLLALMGLLLGSNGMVALGLAWPALYLTVLIGSSLAMALRHRSLCGLWAGPALAAMHIPWGAGFLSGILRKESDHAR